MNLGDRYQIDTTPKYNDLRMPEGQQPAKPLFTGVIGAGNTAEVYRCIDRQTGQAVAIKVLNKKYATDFKFVTRFQRQAKLAMNLQHPNIVQVYDYGQFDGNYFTVMELVEGTNLRRYLRSRINQYGGLDIERAIAIAHDVALALGAIHNANIVHANLDPPHILIAGSGVVKLTVFTGTYFHTVNYSSPERAQGELLFPATDVYSFGVILYEMVTGRLPFDSDTPVVTAMKHIQETPAPPGQFNQNIPQALEEIIMRCLEKVPEMRYRNGSELARALQDL